MPVWLLLASFVHASPPTAEVAAFSGTGTVGPGSSSVDGTVVAFVSGGLARVIDVERWQQTTLNRCSATAVGVVEPEGGGIEVWVGCNDGTVRPYGVLVDGTVEPVEDSSGEPIVLTVGDNGDDIVAIAAEGDAVYAVSDGTVATSHLLDATDLSVTSSVPTTYPGFTGAISDGWFFYVAHDNALMSTFTVPANNPIGVLATGVLRVDDMSPTSFATGAVLTIDRDDSVAQFLGFNKSFQIVLPSAPGIQAIGSSVDPQESYALLAYGDRCDVHPMTAGQISSVEPSSSFDLTHTLRDIVVTSSGYTLAGATNGDVVVLSDRPWVDMATPDLGEVAFGDAVTVSFDVDRPGSWELRIGGRWTGGGTLLAEGTVAVPGRIDAELTVDGDWPDGSQDIYVLYTDQDDHVGHGWAGVQVQAPPAAVMLDASNVAFAEGTVTLTFDPLSSEDIDTYAVYLTTEPFTAADYPTGGPAFVGDDEVEAPVLVQDFSIGEAITVELAPLTDYVTYYLAVRATDSGGLEGTMSNVVEVVPRPTLTASELAGDPGGMQCSAVGSTSGAPWLAGLGLALFGLRRRRLGVGAGIAAAALVGLALAAPQSALAQDDGDETPDPRTSDPEMSDGYKQSLADEDSRTGDLTKSWGNAEVRYGYWQTQDPSFEAVFGNTSAGALMVEGGAQLFRVLELDLGAGMVSRKGVTVAIDDLKPTGTETRLMIVPLSASITPRLHLVDEQPLVPFASIGGDWWLWREREGAADADNKIVRNGSHFGWHWEVGANLLLDVFDRRRASLLEAQSGINDSWVTFSYRRQTDLAAEGMDFSGGVYQIGLKVDF